MMMMKSEKQRQRREGKRAVRKRRGEKLAELGAVSQIWKKEKFWKKGKKGKKGKLRKNKRISCLEGRDSYRLPPFESLFMLVRFLCGRPVLLVRRGGGTRTARRDRARRTGLRLAPTSFRRRNIRPT